VRFLPSFYDIQGLFSCLQELKRPGQKSHDKKFGDNRIVSWLPLDNESIELASRLGLFRGEFCVEVYEDLTGGVARETGSAVLPLCPATIQIMLDSLGGFLY
jgi:hypothetical protein